MAKKISSAVDTVDTDYYKVKESGTDYGLHDPISIDIDRQDIIQSKNTGQSWEVTYYRQILKEHSTTSPVDINTTKEYQHYEKLERIVLAVQSAIEQGSVTDVSGEAMINIGFAPAVNDHFVARLREGRIGLFVVTEIYKENYTINTLYKISYKLYGFEDTNRDLFENLESKVGDVLVYNKDAEQTKPVLENKSIVQYKEKLSRVKEEIKQHYLQHFINHQLNTIAFVTKDGGSVIDLNVSSFFFSLFPKHCNQELLHLREYPNVYQNLKLKPTIYTLLLKDTIVRFEDLYKGFTCVETSNWIKDVSRLLIHHKSNPMSYYAVDFLIDYIKDPYKDGIELLREGVDYKDIYRPRNIESLKQATDINEYVLKKTEKDFHYALGVHFYSKTMEKQTYFEKLVSIAIADELLPMEDLKKACEECYYWDLQDKFFLMPILIYLIDYQRGVYHGVR